MDKTVNKNPILTLLRGRNEGQRGIYACCCANEYVLRAAIRRAKQYNTVVLVEATANQVNQNGGYTGMTPGDFRSFLNRLAAKEGMPAERVFCGGDHLGPLTWRNLSEAEAMSNAKTLVRSYVLAGFSKIHLDTSMRLGGDDANAPLSDETIARRGAELCAEAEAAFAEYSAENPDAPAPVYVIGSEVPIPGGAMENEETVSITSPENCRATLRAFEAAFYSHGLSEVWNRVAALVVQPGVEFADESVVEYNRAAAKGLVACLSEWPGLVFEGHSTDYQPRERLREMAQDGIAILKVGPALTFALREGLFALERIETELARLRPFPTSSFRSTLEWAMREDDKYWGSYYRGREASRQYARAFSFSDRARYYLPEPRVSAAISTLLSNLDREGIPLGLLSQYLPVQYRRVRSGDIALTAADLLIDHVGSWIDDYLYATIL